MKSSTATPHVILWCTSYGHACGIARYTQYVHDSLTKCQIKSSIVRTIDEIDEILSLQSESSVSFYVVVQHEYGLFDHFNTLGSLYTTAEMLSYLNLKRAECKIQNACIIMHTLVVSDHVLQALNRQIFSSGIRVFMLNKEGAIDNSIDFIEHGILSQKIFHDQSSGNRRIIGAFGMLSGNKMHEKIIDLCSQSKCKLIGQFASKDAALSSNLIDYANGLGSRA